MAELSMICPVTREPAFAITYQRAIQKVEWQVMARRQKKQQSGAGCGVLLIILVIAGIYGGISSCVGNAASSTIPTDDYSTYVPPADDYSDPSVPAYPSESDPATDDPGSTDDGGSLNLPGDGYVSGPGVNCGLSGCNVDMLPHFGFGF